MPWYRIYANHGPGHQSSTEFYRWYEKPLDTKDKRKEAWEEEFAYNYDWPIGDVELCDKLPQHIHDNKIKGFQSDIEHAHRMLDVLRGTPTKPVICVRFVVKPGLPGKKPTMGFQACLMSEPDVLGPMRPGKDEAVDALLSTFRRENRRVRQEKKGATRHSRRKDYAVIVR
jgi:hypothetical protein